MDGFDLFISLCGEILVYQGKDQEQDKMPDIVTTVGHLMDLDLYRREKPYCVLVTPEQAAKLPPGTGTSNIEFELHENVLVKDIRGHKPSAFGLDKTGFEVASDRFEISDIEEWSGLRQYQAHTEKLLQARFGVERAVCWEVTVRCFSDEESSNTVFLSLVKQSYPPFLTSGNE